MTANMELRTDNQAETPRSSKQSLTALIQSAITRPRSVRESHEPPYGLRPKIEATLIEASIALTSRAALIGKALRLASQGESIDKGNIERDILYQQLDELKRQLLRMKEFASDAEKIKKAEKNDFITYLVDTLDVNLDTMPDGDEDEEYTLRKEKHHLIAGMLPFVFSAWRDYCRLNLDQLRPNVPLSEVQENTFCDTYTLRGTGIPEPRTMDQKQVAALRSLKETNKRHPRTWRIEGDDALSQALLERGITTLKAPMSRAPRLSIDAKNQVLVSSEMTNPHAIAIITRRDGKLVAHIYDEDILEELPDNIDEQSVNTFLEKGLLNERSGNNPLSAALQLFLDNGCNVDEALRAWDRNPVYGKQYRDPEQRKEYMAAAISTPYIRLLSQEDIPEKFFSGGIQDENAVSRATHVQQLVNEIAVSERNRNPYTPAVYVMFRNKFYIALSGAYNHVVDDGGPRARENEYLVSTFVDNLKLSLSNEQIGFTRSEFEADDISPSLEDLKTKEANYPIQGFARIENVEKLCKEISTLVRTMKEEGKLKDILGEKQRTPLTSRSMILQLIINTMYRSAYASPDVTGNAKYRKQSVGTLFASDTIADDLQLYPISEGIDPYQYLQLSDEQREAYLYSLIEKTAAALTTSDLELAAEVKRSISSSKARQTLNALANTMKAGMEKLSGEMMMSAIFPKTNALPGKERVIHTPTPAKSKNQRVALTIAPAGSRQEGNGVTRELLSLCVKDRENVNGYKLVQKLKTDIEILNDTLGSR